MKKRIAILGSTGSIGVQALEVVSNNPDLFEIEVLTANRNADLLIEQAVKFQPNTIVIADESQYDYVKTKLQDFQIKVFAGVDSLNQVVTMDCIDLVLTAMVGFSGLVPTVNAIKSGKIIALANKETLVVAGEIITRMLIENKTFMIPVDSEHSAIFQCLIGEKTKNIEKIYLTASGGPFRDKNIEFLKTAKKDDALKHPIWNMGSKITIDSATMMNKGLEAIEAKWLFDLKPEQIEIVIHPQSIIHSFVQFQDGSIKAQMSLPDMKLPIQYALTFPDRAYSPFERLDFFKFSSLTFSAPDLFKFPCISLAFEAMKKGGNLPCIMNAANEIAVEAFLADRISFLDIPRIIENSMNKISFLRKPDLNDFIETDKETRKYTKTLIN